MISVHLNLHQKFLELIQQSCKLVQLYYPPPSASWEVCTLNTHIHAYFVVVCGAAAARGGGGAPAPAAGGGGGNGRGQAWWDQLRLSPGDVKKNKPEENIKLQVICNRGCQTFFLMSLKSFLIMINPNLKNPNLKGINERRSSSI
jgi:hypothetical protein